MPAGPHACMHARLSMRAASMYALTRAPPCRAGPRRAHGGGVGAAAAPRNLPTRPQVRTCMHACVNTCIHVHTHACMPVAAQRSLGPLAGHGYRVSGLGVLVHALAACVRVRVRVGAAPRPPGCMCDPLPLPLPLWRRAGRGPILLYAPLPMSSLLNVFTPGHRPAPAHRLTPSTTACLLHGWDGLSCCAGW